MPRPFDPIHPVESSPGETAGPVGAAGPPGPPSNQPFDIQIFSGDFSTTSNSPIRTGSRFLDLTPFPDIDVAGRTRRIEFVVNLEVGIAGTGNVRLRNRDDAETVVGTYLTTSSLTNIELRSGPLTVGIAAGDLKDDKMYEVEVYHTGGTPADAVSVTNARLEIMYV